MKLKDRVAIITGAGSGIGAATAVAMAAEGARVVVADINEAGTKATVEQIEKAGGRALGVRADVTVLSKALGGGVPIAAVLMTASVAGALAPGMHGCTFGGGPLADRKSVV